MAVQRVASCVLVTGNNADGQLGLGLADADDDKVFELTPVAALQDAGVAAATMSLKHTAWLTQDGTVYTAGDNDDGQLGRAGKRSRPLKVDAIEHLPVGDVATGSGFTLIAARLDGRLLAVGRGERGQLGMGGADRDNRLKLRVSSALGDEQLLTLSAGDAHAMALSRSGHVLAFGENKHGQLGLGDFVSTSTPKPVPALRCRPVVRLCCGQAHTLAMTATGLLWSWGLNEHGQLGLGDLKPRYKPEQVKAMRVPRCADISAGSRHTLALSERGLVFAFGAGGSGQLGSGGTAEAQPYPQVVQALQEVGPCRLVSCGHSHSFALAWSDDTLRECLYCWGLGASGQLGLAREALQDGRVALLPQRLRLPPGLRVVDVVSGPLAHHTCVLLAAAEEPGPSPGAPGAPGAPEARAPARLRHALRTAIDADELLATLRSIAAVAGDAPLRALTAAVGAAFSSASVLNASFRSSTGPLSPTEEASGVDLLKVRRAYHTLVYELNSPELVATLGRATLSICDELAKQRVPTDDPENISVFLVIFENPLLLAEGRTALFPGYHVAVQRLTSAVRSLPMDSQRLLFGWLKHLPSEYFARVVEVMQQYVTFTLTQPGQNRADASPAVLMLQTLWDINGTAGGIVPEWIFHNQAISASEDLQEHYWQWQQQQSFVFSYCRHPFLLSAEAKRRLLSYDSKLLMESAMQELVAQSWRQALPSEPALEQLLQFRVRREHLLSDFCGQLWWRLKNRPACLRLPLSVDFVGEFGMDAGGLRKECLQLVLKQLYMRTQLFVELEDVPGVVWFRPTADYWGSGRDAVVESSAAELALHDADWWKHLPQLAGAMVGLAGVNGLYLDLRLHPLVYRFLVQGTISVSFDDLQAMHPTLHRSLTSLKQASNVESLCLSWSVRLPGGDADYDVSADGAGEAGAQVRSADVATFVAAYAEAALVGGVRKALTLFVKAATECLAAGPAYGLCSSSDLELLLCGWSDVGQFRDLEEACIYADGFHAGSLPVRLFWEVVHGMSEVWKRRLLLFCTGCDRVPIAGLKALRFVVSRSNADLDHLPTANTCVNQINLPEYDSTDVMRSRLYAALEHHVGFGFA